MNILQKSLFYSCIEFKKQARNILTKERIFKCILNISLQILQSINFSNYYYNIQKRINSRKLIKSIVYTSYTYKIKLYRNINKFGARTIVNTRHCMQNIISNKTFIHSCIMFYYDFLFLLLIFILLFQIKKLSFYSQHSANGNLYFWPYQTLMDHNSVQQTFVDIFERNWNYPRIYNQTNKFLSH